MPTYDVFVSYAHKDQMETRWVDKFVKEVATNAGSNLPRDLKYFFDDEIEVGAEVPQRLLDVASDSRVLLLLLSPRYKASPWCISELRCFLERRKTTDANIFVVEITKVDRDHWPEELQLLETVKMWDFDPPGDKRGHPRRFDPERFGEESKTRFNKGASDTAYMLTERLQKSEVVIPSKGAVWIAETTDDLARYRKKLVSRLDQAGWRVLPGARSYSRHDKGVYVGEVEKDLVEAKLYIQIFSSVGGTTPEWSALPFPVLQANLARAAAARNNVRWLRWRAKGMVVNDDEPAEYSDLVWEGGVQESTPGGFEEEIDRVLKALSAPPPPPPSVGHIEKVEREEGSDSDPMIVYVHSAPVDQQLARNIQTSLLTMKVDSVGTPPPSPDSPRQTELEPLKSCDGVILVYGKTDPGWVTGQWGPVRRAFSKVKSDGQIGVLKGPPPPKPDIPIVSDAVHPLDCVDGINQEELAGFIARLRARAPRREHNGGV